MATLPSVLPLVLLLGLLGLRHGSADEYSEDELYSRTGVPVSEVVRQRENAVSLGRQCRDVKHPTQCGSWAASGECRKNSAYMRKYCSRACDFCEDSPTIVFMEESAYGKIFVVDEQGVRHLRFDQWQGDDQSTLNLTDPNATPMEYIRFASLLGTAFGVSSPSRALAVGLGGGGFVTAVHAALPNAMVEAVDIDATVVRVAREHFGLRRLEADPNSRLQLFVGDGHAYLQRQEEAAIDSIFVDCYIAGVPSDRSDIPDHIVSDDFFQLLHSRLRPSGVAVINIAENNAAAEMAMVSRFSRAFNTRSLSPTGSNSKSCTSGSARGRLDPRGRARLGRVLAAMRAAGSSNGWDWATNLARVFVDDDEMVASGQQSGAGPPGLVAWLGARLEPFFGTAVALGWTSREDQAADASVAVDSVSPTLCGFVTVHELERILSNLGNDNIQSEPPAYSIAADQDAGRTTGCLALLTPESTNLLLVGQA